MRPLLGALVLSGLFVCTTAHAQEEEEAPDEPEPALAITVVSDDAPLTELVAQRRAIEEGEAGGQRGLFALPALGSLVEGATSFLVERAQAEVESFGAQVLQETLCTDEPVAQLVPTACEVLRTWGDGAPSRANLDTLVAAMRTDLRRMPPRLIRVAIAASASAGEHVQLGLASLSVLLEGIDAGVELYTIADRLFDLAVSCDVTSEGLRTREECTTPEGKAAQRTLLRRANLLIWAIGNPVDDAAGTAILGPIPPERVGEARRAIRRLLSTLRDWQRTARWLQDPDPGADAERRREMAAGLARLTADLVFVADDAVRVPKETPPSERARDETRGAVVALVTSGATLDSSAALAETLRLLRAGVPWILGDSDADGVSVAVPPSVLQALATASALASARDADSVRAVLHSLTAPVASWRSKRDGFMVSLTGLVGLRGSYDLLAEDGDFSTLGDLTTAGFGVQLAVGVDFNLVGGGAGTLGFFVQIVDLGNLVDFPLAGDTDQVEVDVHALSMLSPGVAVRYGVASTPLVLSLGGAFVPRARSGERTDAMGNAVEVSFDALRLFATLSVDTTLWIF